MSLGRQIDGEISMKKIMQSVYKNIGKVLTLSMNVGTLCFGSIDLFCNIVRESSMTSLTMKSPQTRLCMLLETLVFTAPDIATAFDAICENKSIKFLQLYDCDVADIAKIVNTHIDASSKLTCVTITGHDLALMSKKLDDLLPHRRCCDYILTNDKSIEYNIVRHQI
jgi:hypothetical protein